MIGRKGLAKDSLELVSDPGVHWDSAQPFAVKNVQILVEDFMHPSKIKTNLLKCTYYQFLSKNL